MKFPSKTEIISCVKVPNLIKDVVLKGGSLAMGPGGVVKTWTGGFSIVFQIKQGNEVWAFKVWHTPLQGLGGRCTLITERLESCALPYFVSFGYSDKGLFVPESFLETQRMKWIDGHNLKEYINLNIKHPERLLSLADKFRKMVAAFNLYNIAHGDLQHGNIIVKSDGQIVVIDYDSMYIEGFDEMLDLIKGQAGYQHPRRQENTYLNSKLDYFSSLIIYLSLLVYSEMPDLWDNDTEWLVFSKEDLAEPNESEVIDQLLESKIPAIAHLTSTLVEFLNKANIIELRPLESILEPKIKVTYPDISAITNKF